MGRQFRGGWRQSLLCLLMLMMVASPVLVRGQEATPTTEDVAAPVEAVVPTAAAEPARNPEGGEVTTPRPEDLPDEVVPTPEPSTLPKIDPPSTPEMTDEVEEGQVPLENTDTLSLVDTPAGTELQPGESISISLLYAVTTPRLSTTIHAELRQEDGSLADGWMLSGQAGASDWVSGAAAIDLVDGAATAPGTSFGITIVVQAPADVATGQQVALYVNSDVALADGSLEGGVSAEVPVAVLVVGMVDVPAPVAPRGSAPLAADGIACASSGLDPNTLLPGGIASFACRATAPLLPSVLNLLSSPTLTISGLKAGWMISIGGQEFTDNPSKINRGLLESLLKSLLGGNAPLSVQLKAPPTYSSDAESALVPIKVEYCLLNLTCVLGIPPGSIEGSVSARMIPPPPPRCAPAVSAGNVEMPSLNFGTSTWQGTAYQSVQASIPLTITHTGDSGCSGLPDGWSVRAQISGLFETAGNGPQPTFVFLGNDPGQAATDGSPTPSGRTAMSTGSPTTIASGSADVPNNATWYPLFELTPPSNAAPGTHSGTITIDISQSSP